MCHPFGAKAGFEDTPVARQIGTRVGAGLPGIFTVTMNASNTLFLGAAARARYWSSSGDLRCNTSQVLHRASLTKTLPPILPGDRAKPPSTHDAEPHPFRSGQENWLESR